MSNLSQRNEKLKQAKKFIPGLTVMAQKREPHRNKYGLAWSYTFSITTKKGIYRAIFTDSIYNHENNILINFDDILSCWIADAECFKFSQNFDDFCLLFGYNFKDYDVSDNRYISEKNKAKKVWKDCEFAYKKMTELLTDEQIEKLHALFQDY